MEVSPLAPENRRFLQDYKLRKHTAGNPGWRPNHSGRYLACYEGLELVVWRATDKLPEIIDRLQVEGVHASFARGLTLTLYSKLKACRVYVGTAPIEVHPRTFLWIPSFFEMRFAPASVTDPETTWRMTLILAAQAAGPRPRAGEISVSTAKEFRNLWPELA